MAVRNAALLSRAVPAAGLLLVMAVPVALAGGGAMAPTFAWSLLVLLGIGAILRAHLRNASAGYAEGLAGAAADLRAMLFYMGFAWGAGAFLALAPAPLLLAAFAGLPCIALALLLGDAAATFNFAAPVTLLALIAAMGRPADAVLILGLQAALGVFLFKNRVRAAIAPAGLALR